MSSYNKLVIDLKVQQAIKLVVTCLLKSYSKSKVIYFRNENDN